METTKVIIGNSNSNLGFEIAKLLKLSATRCILDKFSNGEIRVEIKENIRNKDIYIVQTGYSQEKDDYNVNDYLMETLIIVDACKRSMANSVNVIMPYYPYSRQDKKDEARSPISAKLVANLLTTAGINRLVVMDLHSSQVQGFFDIPVDNIYSIKLVMKYFSLNIFNDLNPDEKEEKYIVVAPDAGSVKRTLKFAKTMGLDMVIMHKQRNYSKKNTVEKSILIGDNNLENKTAIVCDDMCDTGGTLIKGVDTLIQHGIKDVIVLITHGIFSGPAIERINKCDYIREIIVSNSIPQEKNQKLCSKIKVFPIESLLANIISRLGTGESISELF